MSDAQTGSRLLDTLQEIAMSTKSADSELVLSKKPVNRVSFSENSQPFGPSAPMKAFKTPGNISVDQRMEKAYYDGDLKAADAVFSLYRDGVLFSKLEKAFSVGVFGERKRRKLVPTRWSITAVDSTLSLRLMEEIKDYQTIDEFRVFALTNLDNVYVAILTPERWKFEWIEAWHSGTAWNKFGSKPEMIGDFEGYFGRKTYAKAWRLLLLDSICSLRISFPGQETIRSDNAARNPSRATSCRWGSGMSEKASGLFSLVVTGDLRPWARPLILPATNFLISKKHWIENSELLKQGLEQRRITDFN